MDTKLKEILAERENRRTVSFLGLDLIITPDQEVKVIEINGANSGSSGLTQLTGRDIFEEICTYLNKKYPELPILIYDLLSDLIYDLLSDEIPIFAQEFGLSNFSDSKFSDENSLRILRRVVPTKKRKFVLPLHPFKTSFEAIIWNFEGQNTIFNENIFLVINPYAIEHATKDKAVIDTLFDGYRQFRPRTCHLLRENIEQDITDFIQESTAEYFVIKPFDEAQGNNIIIYSKTLADHYSPVRFYRLGETGCYPEPNLLLEELIQSKEIYSKRTEERHYGCMRYIVLVESEDGKINIKHFGGYWRLAPKNIHSDDLPQKFIANLCKRAIPELAEKDELQLVQDAVEQFLPTVYRRLLRLPMNERPDELELTDYCY